jgi:hypothetical protein
VAREAQRIDTEAVREAAREAAAQAREAAQVARLYDLPHLADMGFHYAWDARDLFGHEFGFGMPQTAEGSAYSSCLSAIA